MKRFVTAGAVVMLVAFAAGSASAEAAWRMGVKGGLALSDFGGSDVEEDIGNRIAFVGGMYAQADVSDRFGIRLEALYHMKGASEDSAGVAATVKLDYLEFPVLVVGQVPVSESATLSAFAGPVVAFNTKGELAASASGVSGAVDIKDYIASFEFSLAFGLGASFDAGSVVIDLDGRYQLGLTSVDDGLGQVLGSATDLDIKNQGWAFMAGIGFPVGGN